MSTSTIEEYNPIDPETLIPPQGKIVFSARITQENHEIFTVNADGGNLVRLTHHDGFDNEPVWSPDGTKIAFVSTRFGSWDICVMNVDGSNVTRITDHPENDFNPSWSPDGQEIVFQSNRDTKKIQYGDDRDYVDIYQLYIVNINDGKVRRITHNPNTDDRHPAWSPDGQQIAFTSNGGIQLVDPEGNNRRVLASDKVFGYTHPAWSPDGQQIAFMEIGAEVRPAIPNILIMNADGSNIRSISELITPGTSPSWSPDGRHIVFDSRGYDSGYTIYVMNVDGSGVTRLVEHQYSSRDANWSPK